MSWDDVQEEMSIAGNPDTIRQIGEEILRLIVTKHDKTNRAEMTNIEFMLNRVLAEVRLWQRWYDRSH